MAATLLFTVEDAFQLQGIGCVLVPGPAVEPGVDIRPGDALTLALPSGAAVDTHVAGFMSIRRTRLEGRPTLPLALPKPLTKDQVPPGTRVFLVTEQTK
jgi:hypothetical protein